ncbi:lysylphosphatidylglycerol synthase domain-containing protein [Corticibacterium sp. UT-5YL-CI-8]|nr:lysylphosphatidylglycerol synthase domain-containing protein [Tianweitania sp. UT-5YL-CI-8]
MKIKDYIWPAIGLGAVALSVWLLYHEWRGLSLDDVWDSITSIPLHGWLLSGLASVAAYAALAGYDHIALLHLGRRISWVFVTICSFTTYALAHNIGGSVLSGAVIRYRAYGSKGLTGQEVGILVALCSLTFLISTIFVSAVVLLLVPDMLNRFIEGTHAMMSVGLGLLGLTLVGLYVLGSWIGLRPLNIGSFRLQYPALPIVVRQLIVGPLELLAAGAIIYFALPAENNPGYIMVLGIFLVSFSAALISHAPGGLGVLEIVFLLGLSDMDPNAVVAALLVFRLFYLIVPFILGLIAVVGFERSQWWRRGKTPEPVPSDKSL